MKISNQSAQFAHPNTAQPARSISFNTTRARERISANLALLSCACADQALHVDIVSSSPNAGDELRLISSRIEGIADEIGGEK